MLSHRKWKQVLMLRLSSKLHTYVPALTHTNMHMHACAEKKVIITKGVLSAALEKPESAVP